MSPTKVESVLARAQEQRQMKPEANAMVADPVGESASDDVASRVARRMADLADLALMHQQPGPGQAHHGVVMGLRRKSNRTNPLPDAQQSDSPGIHAPFSNICNKCVCPMDIRHTCNRNQLCRLLLG